MITEDYVPRSSGLTLPENVRALVLRVVDSAANL